MSTPVTLALGRMFRIMARTFQAGDLEDYERCRAVILAEAGDASTPYTVDYARDHAKGAQGD